MALTVAHLTAPAKLEKGLVMQHYRRGSLARALSTLWYYDLTDVQRLRFGVQASVGDRVSGGECRCFLHIVISMTRLH
jgi:hypothetical protein